MGIDNGPLLGFDLDAKIKAAGSVAPETVATAPERSVGDDLRAELGPDKRSVAEIRIDRAKNVPDAK